MFKIYTALLLVSFFLFHLTTDANARLCVGPSRNVNVFVLCDQGMCSQYFYTYEEGVQSGCSPNTRTILKEDRLFGDNLRHYLLANNKQSHGVYHLVFTNKCNEANLESDCLVFNKTMLVSIEPQDYPKIKEEEKNKIIEKDILIQDNIKSGVRSAYLQAIFYPLFPLFVVFLFRRKAVLAAILGLTTLSLPFFLHVFTINIYNLNYIYYYEVNNAKYYAEIIRIALTCLTTSVIFIFLFSKFKHSFKTPQP